MIFRSFAILFFILAALTLPAYADQGKVLKVVDGDTFLAEVDGKRGPETIEVNLRCSDAPIINAAFGEESRKFLEQLLGLGSLVDFKVQAFCGSEKCVEALVYFPPEEDQPISYINTRMIDAGMARNLNCRGQFANAESAAKQAKSGIWSTDAKIAFTETVKKTVAKPEPAKTTTKTSLSSEKEAPAVIRYDRAERTVTMKSRKMSLTRAVDIINTVSPSPIKVYLQEEKYIPINVENGHWYDALQYVVETADLKQVNLDGKIDLYTRMFYYKHVSPYLKVAGNVGVYMNTGSAPSKELTKDDGTTRYVFINEFENSAEVAKQYRETKARTEESIDSSSGFIQVHDSSAAPVSNYGTFERSVQKTEPVRVAAVEPAPVAEVKTAPVKAAEPVVDVKKPTRAPLKPYSGEKVVSQEEKPAVASPPDVTPVDPTPVVEKSVPLETPAEKATPPVPADEEAVAAVASAEGTVAEVEAQKTSNPPMALKPPAAPAMAMEFSILHAVAIVVILVIVIVGCIFLTRSAGARAAEAEKHVEPDELKEKEEDLPLDIDAQVDKKYEEEIFDELDHVADKASDESDEVFDDASDKVETTDESESSDESPDDSESVEDPPQEEPVAEEPPEEESEKHEPKPLSGKDKRIQPEDSDSKESESVSGISDEAAQEAERVPRKICLFEVKCLMDGNSFTGIGLDISNGGLFVDSKQEIEIGKVVELEFKLFEDDEKSVRCRGAVTWYNRRPDPIKPDYPNGFGVRFVDMDAMTKEFIDEYLALDDEDS